MAASNQHHGGAWKVAYADFITAMMALFMVLWLTSQKPEIAKEMSEYFQDPYNTPMDNSMGILENDSASAGGLDEGKTKGKAEISDIRVLYEMAEEFMRLLNVENVNRNEDPVDLEVTSDGLRVTLYDRDAHPFFVDNSAEYTEWGKFVVETLAWLVQRHSFKVRIDGYVAEGFESKGREYTEWELSSDRATSTRRNLERYGVRAAQFESMTAHGTTKPLPFMKPDAESNDRISISLVLTETFNIYEKGR